ncbi:MAG: D-arabinono-1,4-lactone oxidase [Nevskia sp.]|nr:D-arabinono-1,4-lactone oxidase [Nevskia sp.]
MTANLSRRELLRYLAALGLPGAGGAALAARPERIIPWRNWSGGQACIPAARIAPDGEQAVADAVRAATGTLRAVGSSHSFSPLVPTEGTLLSLNNLTGMIGADSAALTSEFWGGTRMSDMGEPLQKAGLALSNMADIDYQTLAGAIATSTHGTGPRYGSYSTQVTGLRLVLANGDIVDCDRQHRPELFEMARASLGALGIVTRVRLQNRKAFRLRRKEWVQNTEELLDNLPQLIRDNDHFELNPLLHCDLSLASSLNETDDTHTIPKDMGGDTEKVRPLALVDTYLRDAPRAQATLLDFFARHIDFPEVVDDSFRVFANVRDVRFNEMEYEVPAEAGPACLREVLKTIREQNLHSYIPLEFRYVKGDDIPLSMFHNRDTCAISVHQYYELDYHNFFAQVEPIFWKYDGRPHWGKLHTLNANQLSRLYPRWKDFLEVRAAVDPAGKFLNGHLRSVLGVNC